MLLGKITEADHQGGSDHLRNDGIPGKDLHIKFEEYIIQEKAANKQKKITEQLYAAPDGRFVEDQITHQHKAHGEIDTKRKK
jgi:hypothetical protein